MSFTLTVMESRLDGAGWYSYDIEGVHFIALVNVVDMKAGGMGNLGAEQLAWLADDVRGRSASTPIVVFAHIPLWALYPEWGWGTADAEQALHFVATLRLGNGPERAHPPIDAEGGGQRLVPHGPFDRFPSARARNRAFAWSDAGAGRQAAFDARHHRGRIAPRLDSPGDHRSLACGDLEHDAQRVGTGFWVTSCSN